MARSITAPDGTGGGELGAEAKKQVKSFGDRIRNLLEERANTNEDITAVFDEAREAGFDTKILRKAVKIAMADPAKAAAEAEMVATYVAAIAPDLVTLAEQRSGDETKAAA